MPSIARATTPGCKATFFARSFRFRAFEKLHGLRIKRSASVISRHYARSGECPLSPCGFNRSAQHRLQFIGRRFEAQGLSRTLIESQGNRIQVTLRGAREVGSSWEVLTQQAVGVFV